MSPITTPNGACRNMTAARFTKSWCWMVSRPDCPGSPSCASGRISAKPFTISIPHHIARYGARDIDRLLKNEGIIRSRAKIEAAIKGAKLWLEIEEEPGGFREFIWKHVDGKPSVNRFKARDQIPAQSEMSEDLARDLKQRGFNFCGPVIFYAFAQAIGMVNDHVTACFRHAECARLAKAPVLKLSTGAFKFRSMVLPDVIAAIGNTPLIRLKRASRS